MQLLFLAISYHKELDGFGISGIREYFK